MLVDGTWLGFSVTPDEARDIAEVGMRIADAADAQLGFRHPENGRDHISFCQVSRPATVVDGVLEGTGAVALRLGKLDRSPSGTGCSARMAAYTPADNSPSAAATEGGRSAAPRSTAPSLRRSTSPDAGPSGPSSGAERGSGLCNSTYMMSLTLFPPATGCRTLGRTHALLRPLLQSEPARLMWDSINAAAPEVSCSRSNSTRATCS